MELALRELEQVQGPKAQGGRWALAGFSFQSLSYIELVVERVLAGSSPADLPAFEQVSDMTSAIGDDFLLVQVKRTLHRASFRDAVLHFAKILDAAEQGRARWGELPDRLRFQIVCQTMYRPFDVDQVEASRIFDGEDAQSRWRTLKAHLATPPIRVAPDPFARILGLLWRDQVLDPFRLVVACSGILLRSAYDPGASTSALAFELHAAITEAPRNSSRGLLADELAPADFALQEGSDEVVIGEVPRPIHIRMGCFRDRAVVRQAVDAEFERWRAGITLDDPQRTKVPVFWVRGRSGCGKSVAMLQLVSRVVGNPDLPPVFRFATPRDLIHAIGAAPPKAPLILAIDDIYQPGGRVELDSGFVSAVRDAAPPFAIVTCGPDEQLSQFRRRLKDVVDVTDVPVPDLSENEFREFVTWHEARRGRPVENLRVRPGRNPLLVQLIFELEGRESLGSFASRFRARLENMGVFAMVRSILAINALYMHYPYSLVPADTAIRLRPLMREHHLEYSEDQEGLRLAHAHLAWCLYAEWAADDASENPDDVASVWAEDLVALTGALLDAGALTTVQEVLHSLKVSAHADPERGDFIPADGCTVVSLVWPRVAGRTRDEVLPLIHLWINLEAGFRATLSPSPIDLAREALRSAAERRLLAHEAVLALEPKDHSQRRSWRDDALKWTRVARDPASAARVLERVAIDRPFESPEIQEAASWFHNHADLPPAPIIAKQLSKASTGYPEMRDQVFAWIRERPDSIHRWDVLPALVDAWRRDQRFLEQVFDWVVRYGADDQVHVVLGSLLFGFQKPDRVRDFAIGWLLDNPDSRSFVQVLLPLINRCWDDTRVQDIADDYVHRNGKMSRRVKARILVARGGRGAKNEMADLTGAGIEALVRALSIEGLTEDATSRLLDLVDPELSNTTAVTAYLSLCARHAGDVRFTQPLMRWLTDHGRAPLAGQVAATLFRHGGTPQMTSAALEWLERHHLDPGAQNALIGILPHHPPDSIFELAWAWVDIFEDNTRSAAEVLYVLTRHDPNPERLRAKLDPWRLRADGLVWAALNGRPGFRNPLG